MDGLEEFIVRRWLKPLWCAKVGPKSKVSMTKPKEVLACGLCVCTVIFEFEVVGCVAEGLTKGQSVLKAGRRVVSSSLCFRMTSQTRELTNVNGHFGFVCEDVNGEKIRITDYD